MSSNLLFKRAPKCCKCYPFYFVYRCSVLQCSDWSGDGRNVPAHPSYSPSSSSNSPSSSAVASWYCWYSETKSFMLDSASVNSISSIPSPVYQCKKALWQNREQSECCWESATSPIDCLCETRQEKRLRTNTIQTFAKLAEELQVRNCK